MLRRAVTESRAHGDEHALLAAAFASLPDAIVAADLDSRVRLVNPAAEALLGVRESEVLGRNVVETLILQPAARAVARESVAQITARRARRRRRSRPGWLRGDGTDFHGRGRGLRPARRRRRRRSA